MQAQQNKDKSQDTSFIPRGSATRWTTKKKQKCKFNKTKTDRRTPVSSPWVGNAGGRLKRQQQIAG
jgi:hypothetical protein